MKKRQSHRIFFYGHHPVVKL